LSLGIPLVIHEQNVIPGMANRLLAARASKIAVSFAGTLKKRPRWSQKAVVTGNPMLEREVAGDRDDAVDYFDLEKERKTLAVVGGSQGAASLNRALLEALPEWRNRSDLQIIHSVGRDKYQEFMAQAAKVDTGSMLYRPLEFIERMDLLYGVADLAVCRAGASTVAELAVAGCAAILVPYPYATAAHQDANAEVLAEEGAAVVIGTASSTEAASRERWTDCWPRRAGSRGCETRLAEWEGRTRRPTWRSSSCLRPRRDIEGKREGTFRGHRRRGHERYRRRTPGQGHFCERFRLEGFP
jgi:UDP-N-acetylglucosamine:LPS N-acetylglucosamine transferase